MGLDQVFGFYYYLELINVHSFSRGRGRMMKGVFIDIPYLFSFFDDWIWIIKYVNVVNLDCVRDSYFDDFMDWMDKRIDLIYIYI